MNLTKEEEKLITDARKIKKCCGTTIVDFEIESKEINQIGCTRCDKSVAFMECEGDLIEEWNKKLT